MSFSTFVINLDSRQDRLDKFLAHNITNLERFGAIKNESYPRLGCTTSHKEILKISRDRGDKFTIIFEDDATLLVPYEDMVYCIENFNTDWSIILFSASQALSTNEYTHIGDHEFIKLRDEFCGSYSMAVNSQYYDYLIQKMEIAKTCDNVDIDIYSKLPNIYLALPFMSYTISDQSDIRTYNTRDDLKCIKLCESRLVYETSFMTDILGII